VKIGVEPAVIALVLGKYTDVSPESDDRVKLE
jgi:hypothetical protein